MKPGMNYENPKSKFLQQLPRYYFDRKSFCKIFEEVFTFDEICHIHMLCFKGRLFENFFFFIILIMISILLIFLVELLLTGISILVQPTPVTKKVLGLTI